MMGRHEIVIDLATLTGAAARAIGKQGIVAMGNDQHGDYVLVNVEDSHANRLRFPRLCCSTGVPRD